MSVGPFIIIDDVFDDTTDIDRLYDLLVNENVSIKVEPPNFIRMNDLEYSSERSEVDNLLRKCIQKVWMDKLYALLKDKDERGELIGFESWNNNLPNDSQVKSLAGGIGGLNYHLDKDEVAYSQRGELRLPIHATAFYIGPKEGLNGGELMINTRGLEHDREYGEAGGGLIDLDDSANWIKIPWKYNRVAILDSSCPHFVMPIVATPQGGKRVTIAINPWDREIGK